MLSCFGFSASIINGPPLPTSSSLTTTLQSYLPFTQFFLFQRNHTHQSALTLLFNFSCHLTPCDATILRLSIYERPGLLLSCLDTVPDLDANIALIPAFHPSIHSSCGGTIQPALKLGVFFGVLSCAHVEHIGTEGRRYWVTGTK